MSTKVWLKRAAEVATGVGFRAAAEVSAEALDTTDFKQKLQDADLIDVLVHGYLGIIFGEAGWPFPEVIKCNFMQWRCHISFISLSYTLGIQRNS